METKIEKLRICRVCHWLSENITDDILSCTRAIPVHIPNKQFFNYRKALVKKHWNLDCEKFHPIH